MNYEKKLKKAIDLNDDILLDQVFEEIYNEYYNLIKYIISKYESNKQDIEEIINDVFYNFFKNIFKIEIINIKYYLVQTAKNLTINHIKSKKDNISYNDDIVLNEINYDNKSFFEDIIFEMKQVLSEYEINIILLHDVYNYKFKELSEKYNKKESSIKATYHRAIKKFNIKERKNVH